MAEEEIPPEEEEKKGSKKKLFIFVGAGLLVVIIGIVLFFLVFGGSKEEPEVEKEKEEEKTEEVITKIIEEDFYPGLVRVPEIKIKLLPENEEDKPWNLRLSLFIEFKTDENKYLLIEKLDIFQKYLISTFEQKKPSEIDDISEKIILKQELVNKITQLLNTDDVENIHFAEFLVLDW